MNTTTDTYLTSHRQFLQGLLDICLKSDPFNTEPEALLEEHQQFLNTLTELAEAETWPEDLRQSGSDLICLIVSTYPHITPHVPRDLFWFFGGQCLHYMPDDEITKFQRLDEARYEAEDAGEGFDYMAVRNQVLGLH